MHKGCQLYVVQIKDIHNEEDKPKLEYYVVLRNFKEVFVDEILDLFSRREINFCIELIPGSSPVSKEPYRMSISDLT
jgi:hypothetical protein